VNDWLAAFLYRWRVPLSTAFIAGAVALSPRVNVTKVDNDLSAWFSRGDPIYQDYDRFRAEFGGTQPLIIALRSESPPAGAPADAGVFTRERLDFLRRITGEIERVPSVQRVQSLATTTIVRALPGPGGASMEPAEGGLDLRRLLDDRSRRSPDDVRDLALKDPLIRGDLVSDGGGMSAIVVTFDEDRLNQSRGAILDRIHSIVDAGLPPGLVAYYNGSIEINETYNRITAANQARFFPAVLTLTLLAMYALFRSFARTLVTLFSILVSIVWTVGLYSVMGFGFNILTAMLAPLVVVLAIADDVHVIQHYDYHRRRTGPEHAFKATVSYLFTPLLGASATTALGLLSLATSDVIAVREFGIGAAVGIMVDFVISLILVPTLLGWVKPEMRLMPYELFLIELLRRAAGFAGGRPRTVIAASLIGVSAAVIGVVRLRVDTNHIGFFAASHPLSHSAAVIDRELAGVYSFHVLLEGAPGSMKTPDTLRRIEQLSAAIERLPFVRKVTSVADYVKRINQELHGGDAAAAVVPEDPYVVAEELFLFALSDDGRRELDRVVSSDFSNAQITVRVPSMSSDLALRQIQAAERLATETFAGAPVKPTVTGSSRLFRTLDHYVVASQISSFATAFVTVFGAFFLIFRSVRFGLLALVPNLIPVFVVLGVMGWLGISVNVATVMVASVALGIVDDDTVHFIHRFRHQIAAGATVDEAIGLAAVIEGRAAFTIAIITSCGFAVLVLSE